MSTRPSIRRSERPLAPFLIWSENKCNLFRSQTRLHSYCCYQNRLPTHKENAHMPHPAVIPPKTISSTRPKFPLFNFYLGSFTERLDSNFSMINGYSNEFFCHSLSKGLKYSPVPLDLPERYIVPRPLLFWIPCIPISTVYP